MSLVSWQGYKQSISKDFACPFDVSGLDGALHHLLLVTEMTQIYVFTFLQSINHLGIYFFCIKCAR